MEQPFKYITVVMNHSLVLPLNPITRKSLDLRYTPIALNPDTGLGFVPGAETLSPTAQIIGAALEAFPREHMQTKICVQGIVPMRIGSDVTAGQQVRVKAGNDPVLIPVEAGKAKWIVGIAMNSCTATTAEEQQKGKFTYANILLK